MNSLLQKYASECRKILVNLTGIEQVCLMIKMFSLTCFKVCVCVILYRSHCFNASGILMPALNKGFCSCSKAKACSTKKMMTRRTMPVPLQKLGSYFFMRFRSRIQSQNPLHQQRTGVESISTSAETTSNIGTKNFKIQEVYLCMFVYNIIYCIVCFMFLLCGHNETCSCTYVECVFLVRCMRGKA